MARRRSESAHRKVLQAAIALVAERGVDGTSMDAVALASGVSKATIYKHWLDKDALLLEIMAEVNGLGGRPCFDTGDIRADMVALLSYRPPEHSEMREKILPHFLAYSARKPEIGNAWRKMVMEPPQRELGHLFRQGIKEGLLPATINFERSLALLIGPIIYWYIFLRHADERPTELARAAVDGFWSTFGQERTVPRNKRA